MSEAPSVSQNTQSSSTISVVAGVATTGSSTSFDKRSAESASGSVSGIVSGTGAGSVAEPASGHVSFGQRLHSALSDESATANGAAISDRRAGADGERTTGAAQTSADARRSAERQQAPDSPVKKPSAAFEDVKASSLRSSAPSLASQPALTSRPDGLGSPSAQIGNVSVSGADLLAASDQNVVESDREGVAGVAAAALVNEDTAVTADHSVLASLDNDAVPELEGALSLQHGSASLPRSTDEKADVEATVLSAGVQAQAVTAAQGSSSSSGAMPELAAQQAGKGVDGADEARMAEGLRPEPAGARASTASEAASTTADAALARQTGRRDGTLQVSGTDGRPVTVAVESDANTSSAGNSGQQEADPRAGRNARPANESVNGLLESDKHRLQELLERQPDARSTQNSGVAGAASAAAVTTPALMHLAAGGWAVPAGINPALMLPGGDPLSPTTPTAPSSVAMFGQAPQAAFGENVRWMVQQGLSSASFTVTPQGMGPVSVTLDMENDGLQIAIHSAQATTREALDLLLPRLREQLQAAGYEQVSVDVSDGGQQHAEGNLTEENGTDTALSNTPESATDDTSSEIDTQSAAMHPGIRGGWHRGMFDITV